MVGMAFASITATGLVHSGFDLPPMDSFCFGGAVNYSTHGVRNGASQFSLVKKSLPAPPSALRFPWPLLRQPRQQQQRPPLPLSVSPHQQPPAVPFPSVSWRRFTSSRHSPWISYRPSSSLVHRFARSDWSFSSCAAALASRSAASCSGVGFSTLKTVRRFWRASSSFNSCALTHEQNITTKSFSFQSNFTPSFTPQRRPELVGRERPCSRQSTASQRWSHPRKGPATGTPVCIILLTLSSTSASITPAYFLLITLGCGVAVASFFFSSSFFSSDLTTASSKRRVISFLSCMMLLMSSPDEMGISQQ
eukprot:Sspe_Gene.3840::Locus_1279_Transcript_1_1_Confidence_1.000_Length_2136::g.3840::m.3840